MDAKSLIAAIAACLFGSGGLVIWLVDRNAKKRDGRDSGRKDLMEIKQGLGKLQDGLTMALENDRVIFRALRTHEINGESEEQERKMDKYFISLLGSKEDGE